MNIYRVTNNESGEEFTATTDEVLERLYITKDALFWHAKNKSDYCGYVIEKIGTDGKPKKPKLEPPRKTQTNKGLDYDLSEARRLNVSYGVYKQMILN